MSRNDWQNDTPSKVTILDHDAIPAQPVVPVQHQTGQQQPPAAPLTGGIPKGGVFHV